MRVVLLSSMGLLLSASDCKKPKPDPGGGGGGGGTTRRDGGGSGCTTTTDPVDETAPEVDLPGLMMIPDPGCILMGRMFMSGIHVTGNVSYEDPVTCGRFDSDGAAIKNLRLDGTMTFGFRYAPSTFPVQLHCVPTIVAITALHPVVTFRIAGDVDLRTGAPWTTKANFSVSHYEISRSTLAFTRFDVAHADPFADAIRGAVGPQLLDRIDQSIADRIVKRTCFCDETAPKTSAYPLYAPGYDPR